MRSDLRSLIQIAVFVGVAVLLVRLFPVFLRLFEGAAVSVSRLGWAALVIILAAWLAWVFSKRNQG